MNFKNSKRPTLAYPLGVSVFRVVKITKNVLLMTFPSHNWLLFDVFCPVFTMMRIKIANNFPDI